MNQVSSSDGMPPIVNSGDSKLGGGVSAEELWRAIQRFTRWLDQSGYASYDPYDIWGTAYGLWARKVYYSRGLLGVPLIAPILLMEVLCPGMRRAFVAKDRFATADGQLILAFANLYDCTKDGDWLRKAEELARDLVGYSVRGYSGLCWGYPFDWQNNRALWRKNTPFITSTPYCFEAFVRLYDLTGNAEYLKLAESIAEFVARDLKDTPTGPDASAGSYSPIDSSKVINASAYRVYVLSEAAVRFNRADYADTAKRNLQFILDSQREDGSWLYGLDGPGSAFIDHFHTCFVLKNLWKANRRLQEARVENAILKGYQYYRANLFDSSGEPRSFSIEPRLQIVRREMYNYAEAITLGSLLIDLVPEAFQMATDQARRLVTRFQLDSGAFITREYLGGLKHRLPFLRWPQAQLFYALTNLLHARSGGSDPLRTNDPAPERRG